MENMFKSFPSSIILKYLIAFVVVVIVVFKAVILTNSYDCNRCDVK